MERFEPFRLKSTHLGPIFLQASYGVLRGLIILLFVMGFIRCLQLLILCHGFRGVSRGLGCRFRG